jgi:hypothetical protein
MNSMTLECEAIHRYRELEAWFTDRNFDELAGLCARLATWHREAYMRIAGTDELISVEALKASAVPWVGNGMKSREFMWRLATPIQLLELALDAEPSEECAVKIRAAINKLGPVNWESAIEAGAAPCLALGAERRISR